MTIQSDILRDKILRLESILAHEEDFTRVDPQLKLIDIELGEEVFLRKIEQFLRIHTETLEKGDINATAFGDFMNEMKILRE